VVTHLHTGEALLEAIAASKHSADAGLVEFLFRLVESVNGMIAHSMGSPTQNFRVISNLHVELAKLCGKLGSPGSTQSAPTAPVALEAILRQSASRPAAWTTWSARWGAST
jgi:hypothetical protein